MIENNELGNLRDQYNQLSKEYDLAQKNEEMFLRLWRKWNDEIHDISKSKKRLKQQIDSLKDELEEENLMTEYDRKWCELNNVNYEDLHYYKLDPKSKYYGKDTTP